MSPDEEGFFQAIFENPTDDTTRLIYADWLEERGETDRAEFLRFQTELSRPDNRDTVQARVQDRESMLKALVSIKQRWSAHFDHHEFKAGFARGILQSLRLEGGGWKDEDFVAKFVAHSESILALGPVETLFVLSFKQIGTDSLLQLLVSRYLRFVRSFGIGVLNDSGVRALSQSLDLPNLTELELWCKNVTTDGICLLADCSRFASLTALTIHCRDMKPAATRALLTSPCLRKVTRLGLRGVTNPVLMISGGVDVNWADLSDYPCLAPETLQELVNSSHAARLVSLDLSANNFSDAEAAAVLDSPFLKNLRKLRIGTGYRFEGWGPAPLSAGIRESLISRFGSDVE